MPRTLLIFLLTLAVVSCGGSGEPEPAVTDTPTDFPEITGKPVVYQVFTRLFGNTNTTNKPWGTIEENGVGKFADFTDEALASIRDLGTTHIWYTGVPHHGVIRDYTDYGISDDDPDVIKGRAGSPYAVKDYYTVNPDLATDPAKRLEEFEALIERTHRHGMRVMIDIVPNHVARNYESLAKPDGVEDFGASDDTSVEYARDNNFYYVPGSDFEVPDSPPGYAPLGGDPHPLADGKFEESPAKWTGNGARAPKPDFNDWFETVKVNYGVRPDGSYDFPTLPAEARDWTNAEHVAFWADKDVPDSWDKFLDITLYWIDKGVDGFRYDMAEMVPIEFWSYLNTAIKARNPDAFLLAEVYNPDLYRDYLQLGRMDYLYDKVGFYDTLKPIMQGAGSTDALVAIHAEIADVAEHMLHFLENHDEQRIASEPFAGDAERGRPAMVVSALISRSPTMLYFGQDVGEPGDDDAGFGDPTRTTIFDYWGVPAHQRYMNDGAFDGGRSTVEELALRDFYERLLSFSATNPAMQGAYRDLHLYNRESNDAYNERLFSFVRWQDDERLIVVSNFGDAADFTLKLPAEIVGEWSLSDGRYRLSHQLRDADEAELIVDGGEGRVHLRLEALQSAVLRVGRQDIVRLDPVSSQFDLLPRNVDVWLPEGYENDDDPYAVLYMHDGQNLFNPDMAYTGVDWGVDEALQSLIDEGKVQKTIVVGIWNSETRWRDYLPMTTYSALGADSVATVEEMLGGSVRSGDYLKYIVDELKPAIDSRFRTKTGRNATFLMGSSMGGLISMEALIRHPETFSAAACLSIHWPALFPEHLVGQEDAVVAAFRDAFPEPGQSRIYFDHGTTELDASYGRLQEMVDAAMRELGYVDGNDWVTRVFEGTGHNESWWRERVQIPLEFLLADQA